MQQHQLQQPGTKPCDSTIVMPPSPQPGCSYNTPRTFQQEPRPHIDSQEEMEPSDAERDRGSQAPGPASKKGLYSLTFGDDIIDHLCTLTPRRHTAMAASVVLRSPDVMGFLVLSAKGEPNRVNSISSDGCGPIPLGRGVAGALAVAGQLPLGLMSWLPVGRRRGDPGPLPGPRARGPRLAHPISPMLSSMWVEI